jgi:thiol-disulfide isomerase/thioredoxin
MLKYIFFIYLSALSCPVFAQQPTVIEGEIKDASDEKVRLTLYRYFNITEENQLDAKLVKSEFKFTFSVKDPAYFSLSAGDRTLQFFLIEPGDSVHIVMDAKKPNALFFTGKSADLLNYQYEATAKFGVALNSPYAPTAVNFKAYFSYIDSCTEAKITFLNAFKGKLSATAYKILTADIIYEGEMSKTFYFFNASRSAPKAVNELYLSYFDQRKTFKVNDTIANSRNLIAYLMQQNELDYLQLYNIQGGTFNFAGKYNLLKALTYGSARERALIYLLLIQAHNGLEAALTSLDDYLNGPYNPEFKEIIRNKFGFQQKFSPGKQAVSFALADENNIVRSLEEFNGKIVLVDFWFNGCVGCASLFKGMSYVKAHFKGNKNIIFVNISVDATRERWLEGIRLYKLDDEVNLYTMGQAENHPVIKSYGLDGYPAQFLIDKQGRYISATPPRADLDKGKALIELIESVLSKN